MAAEHFSSTYLRLRPDCSIEHLPVDARFWPRLMAGELGDFRNEYLVSSFECSADWPNWERHPNGDEVVALLSGAATLVLEDANGTRREVQLLQPGSFCVIPRGTWHTAKVASAASMFFITPGEGTEHRPA
ncbi:MAG: cupin domain-containing protein [Pseudomonadota bacterium]|nr:cupin domain-containing protein [Pseudomonadota bacterium]